MTITTEQKQALAKSGKQPVRVADPETNTAYVIVREDVYRKLQELAFMDHSDESLFEYGEFYPDK